MLTNVFFFGRQDYCSLKMYLFRQELTHTMSSMLAWHSPALTWKPVLHLR